MWLRSKLFWKLLCFYLLPTTLALGVLLTAVGFQLQIAAQSRIADDLKQKLAGFREDFDQETLSADIVRQWQTIRRSIDKSCFVMTKASDDGLPAFEIVAAPTSPPSPPQTPLLSETLKRQLWRRSEGEGTVVIWDPVVKDVVYAAVRLPDAGGQRCVVLRHDAQARLYEINRINQLASFSIILMWSIGVLCFVVAGALFASPIRVLAMSLLSPSDSLQRRDAMLRIRERNDELGELTRSIDQLEEAHQNDHRRQQAQVKLMRESTNQLSAILQAMVEGVIAIDQDQSILFANDVACRLMDLNDDHAMGRPLFECVRSSVVLDTVETALETNELQTIEFRLPRRDSYLNLAVSPLAKSGVVLVLHDVTEIRRLEVLRKDFMNGVSHELKTPLTVIQACTDTLLNGAIQEPEAARRFLTKINAQSERLHHLIVGMLQLSRLESGQQVFTEEAVDLAGLARDLTMQLQPISESTRIKLQYEGPEEAYVLGDQQAVRTVINNLIDNALKYTNEGGQVDVIVREEEDANAITVRDSGVGISKEDQARIFERFYRVEKDRNRERGGTGLGLAIVKHVCNALQADVSVHSEQGLGTEFMVRFPFREDADGFDE